MSGNEPDRDKSAMPELLSAKTYRPDKSRAASRAQLTCPGHSLTFVASDRFRATSAARFQTAAFIEKLVGGGVDVVYATEDTTLHPFVALDALLGDVQRTTSASIPTINIVGIFLMRCCRLFCGRLSKLSALRLRRSRDTRHIEFLFGCPAIIANGTRL